MNLECVGLAEIFVPGKWEIFDYFSSFFGSGKGENKKGEAAGRRSASWQCVWGEGSVGGCVRTKVVDQDEGLQG
jgi:hypothetical protein